MELHDVGIELPSPAWHTASLIAGHCHYDLFGLESALAGCYDVPFTLSRKPIHAHAGPNR